MQHSQLWLWFELSVASGSSFELMYSDALSKSKTLLSTASSYVTVLKFFKLRTLLIDHGSHKQYAMVTTLAMV